MQLKKLKPSHGVDLNSLQSQLKGKDSESAMPSALPEGLLLQLAMDFRRVETGGRSGELAGEIQAESLAVVMLLVMHVIGVNSERLDVNRELLLSEGAWMRAIQIYQIGLEREVLTRITGLPPACDEEILMNEIRLCGYELG